jgi:group I intron endonuclease
LYIGQSQYAPRRFAQHRYQLRNKRHRNGHLQNAWNKYGAESFSFIVLGTYESRDALNQAEIAYIAQCKVQQIPLYNIANGGEAAAHTPESRQRMSQRRMGITYSAETREKIAATLRGRTLPAAVKAKIGAYWRGRKRGPCSAATKTKMSTAARRRQRRPMTEATKDKLRLAFTGRTVSPETRANMRASRLRNLEEKNLRNFSQMRMLRLGDRTQCLADWADEAGMDRTTLADRLDRYGYTLERALTEPVRHKQRAAKSLSPEIRQQIRALKGRMRQVDIAAQFGVSQAVVSVIHRESA